MFETEKDYTIFFNPEKEVMITISERRGALGTPRLLYDGGEHALLYRNEDQIILLDYVTEEFRRFVPRVESVYIAEEDSNKKLAQVYLAEVVMQESLPGADQFPETFASMESRLKTAKEEGNLNDVAEEILGKLP